ncbi:MAG: hypothetical protein KUG82_18280 [Pseudomonadales bacterium]|nr:hypothetical protein [Pseudomonadales bacterium]
MNPFQFINKIHSLGVTIILATCLISQTFGADYSSNNSSNDSAKYSSTQAPLNANQSIHYWKPHVISHKGDKHVARAHQIFERLLRGWEASRIHPDLYVVNSTAGPWAASLADGNILLSRSAIDLCFSKGTERGQDLLAFVLAHELAHQRADDLWHQKFFRMIGNQASDIQQQLNHGLADPKHSIAQVESIEAQADHDGIIMMATVGFEPARIVEDQDFFTLWVESLWKAPCEQNSEGACSQAKIRALRTRTQLRELIQHATVYELGVQAMVAQQFELAREYFIGFGKHFPGHVVHTAIALTYLMPAIELDRSISQLMQKPQLYYPLYLAASPPLENITERSSEKRGLRLQAQQQKRNRLVKKSQEYLNKAIQLAPDRTESHLMLASSYLMLDNIPMARGIIQGNYEPEFGSDNASALALALIEIREEKYKMAASHLIKLQNKSLTSDQPLLEYAAVANLANVTAQLEGAEAAEAIWLQSASLQQHRGNSMAFQLSLSQLSTRQLSTTRPSPAHQQPAQMEGMRVGDVLDPRILEMDKVEVSTLWLQGDPLQRLRLDNGISIIVGQKNRVVAIWQESLDEATIFGLNMGDDASRISKVLGLPNRTIPFSAGEYLAFDDIGLALKVDHQQIHGWFLY